VLCLFENKTVQKKIDVENAAKKYSKDNISEMNKFLSFQIKIVAEINNSICEKIQEIFSDKIRKNLHLWVLQRNIDHLSKEEVY
jgi:hypothetical protein